MGANPTCVSIELKALVWIRQEIYPLSAVAAPVWSRDAGRLVCSPQSIPGSSGPPS